MIRSIVDPDLPRVVTAYALIGAMIAVATSALTESDGWLFGALLGLVIDALFLRVHNGLREGDVED